MIVKSRILYIKEGKNDMGIDIKTKKCSKCGIEHTGTKIQLSKFFPWSNKKKGYLASLCKECNRERSRNFRNNNKDRYNNIAKQWREENKDYYKNLSDSKKELIEVISGNLFNMDDDKLNTLDDILTNRLKKVKEEIKNRKL